MVMLCVAPNGTPIGLEFLRRIWEVESLYLRGDHSSAWNVWADGEGWVIRYLERYPNDKDELDRLSSYKM